MTARLVRLDDGEAMHLLASPDSPLSPYVNVRERDLVRSDGEGGLFIAEGEVVVNVMCSRGRFPVRSLLLEARRVATMADALGRLRDDVPAYVVSQTIMDRIVGFPIHRGILAAGVRGPAVDLAALLAREGAASQLLVGLIGLANHDNVGSVFRNAAAFGAAGVLIDDETCDPLYRKAIRVSVGAALVVPFARAGSAHPMIDRLEASGWEVVALTPRGPTSLDELPPAPRRVLLLGTEGKGLPEDVLLRARPVRIAMDPTLDSLNVAVASGIALYEASRRARGA